MNLSLQLLFSFVVSCLTLTFTLAASQEDGEPAPSQATNDLKAVRNYQTLSPLIISIVKPGKVYGYLRLEIQLATKDGTSIEPYQDLHPFLIDAYMRQLYSLIGDRWIPGQPLSQETILQILRDITSKIVKENKKSDNVTVLLKSFFFTPANK